MPKPGKRYLKSTESVESSRAYDLSEAMELIKAQPDTKFDQTVDIAIRLGVDPRHADQMVRGALVLPHGLRESPLATAFRASSPAAIITLGLLVLVQLVIAAMTTAPSVIEGFSPLRGTSIAGDGSGFSNVSARYLCR